MAALLSQSHCNSSMSDALSSIDILPLIAQCLAKDDFLAFVQFAHVCKSWRQVAAVLQRRQRAIMPWLFSFHKSGRFGLSDFWSPKPNFHLEHKISPKLRKFITDCQDDQLGIFASKHGWLLLLKVVGSATSNKLEFLLCSPFSNKIIELDQLYLDLDEEVDNLAFNTRGKSSHYVVNIISRGKGYRLHTCKLSSRNKKWTCHKISLSHVEPCWINSSHSTYMDGTLYCLVLVPGTTSLIGLASQDSKVVTTVYHSSSDNWIGIDFFQLFESNGDLLLAARYHGKMSFCHWRVYQFDPLRKDSHWSPIQSLGNKALAVNTLPGQYRRESVVVVHEAKEFVDMIIDNNTTYIRETDDRGSIWRKDKNHQWDFMSSPVVYIEPIMFA